MALRDAPRRRLGPFEVAPIGLGCMNLSHVYHPLPDEATAIELLNTALDLGVDHLDTAALYGFGSNEKLLGKAVGSRRDEYTLASKCGMTGVDGKRVIDGRPQTITRTCDEALTSLKTDVIDLYYLHRLDPNVPVEESVGAMAELATAGKIRAIGLSEVSAATIRRAHEVHPIAAVQNEYSLWTRNPELGSLQACAELGIALVAFSPLARGVLTATPPDVASLPQKDLRVSMPRFQGEAYEGNLSIVAELDALAREAGATLAQLALAWVLSRGENVVAIPGTRSVEHLREDLGVATVRLTQDVLDRADGLLNADTVHGPRYGAGAAADIDTEPFPRPADLPARRAAVKPTSVRGTPVWADTRSRTMKLDRRKEAPVDTVRDLTYDVLAHHGVMTIFGNPGSNELPFLAGMPREFRYVLGLHEGAVVGMADGYAQATGRPVLVNLHAASGTGNAMGALTNAASARTPIVVLAGQQVRTVVGMDGMLSSIDAAHLTRPLTGFAAEPLTPTDVPRTVLQAILEAQYGRRGPAYVSVPYDDWDHPIGAGAELLLGRSVHAPLALGDNETAALADRLTRALRPALVLGADLDGNVDPEGLMRLAEHLDADVWVAPSTWRMPYPHRHRQFRGVLPAGIASINTALSDNDLAVVLGAPVFRYHQHEPGAYLAEGTTIVHITDDPGAATRAPIGEALIADPARVATDLARLLSQHPGSSSAVEAGSQADAAVHATHLDRWTTPPPPAPGDYGRLSPAQVFATLRETLPADTAYVVESTSTNADWWDQMDLRLPRSYYFPASGGLGFGLPAAVGVALAEHDMASGRRVVGVIGDGSAQYGIQALWTAAQLQLPVTFVILRNGTYGALRWFAGLLGAEESPGLDIPDIDVAALARGYGVEATTVTDVDALAAALAAPPTGPLLVQIDTTTTTPDGSAPSEENP